MRNTTSGEDAAADRASSDVEVLVEALRRLDDIITDKDAEIERLGNVIEALNAELENNQ